MKINMDLEEDRPLGHQFNAYLDGKNISRCCVMADEEAGVVECYVRLNGSLVPARTVSRESILESHPNAFIHNSVWRERLYGRVELKRV